MIKKLYSRVVNGKIFYRSKYFNFIIKLFKFYYTYVSYVTITAHEDHQLIAFLSHHLANLQDDIDKFLISTGLLFL